jgi:hypothetical protein
VGDSDGSGTVLQNAILFPFFAKVANQAEKQSTKRTMAFIFHRRLVQACSVGGYMRRVAVERWLVLEFGTST